MVGFPFDLIDQFLSVVDMACNDNESWRIVYNAISRPLRFVYVWCVEVNEFSWPVSQLTQCGGKTKEPRH